MGIRANFWELRNGSTPHFARAATLCAIFKIATFALARPSLTRFSEYAVCHRLSVLLPFVETEYPSSDEGSNVLSDKHRVRVSSPFPETL